MEVVLDAFDENLRVFGFQLPKKISGIGIRKFSELHASEEVFELLEDSELRKMDLDLEGSLANIF
jgi:hypothetical protein